MAGVWGRSAGAEIIRDRGVAPGPAVEVSRNEFFNLPRGEPEN